MPKKHKKCQNSKKYQKMQHVWTFLASFLKHIQIFFVTVTQCNKQKICLLQWLSATNKTNLCCGNSVRQTILKKNIQFLCAMWQTNWKKSQKKILWNLNFTTAFRLIWNTFVSYSVQIILQNMWNDVMPEKFKLSIWTSQ